jgi:hypothetical protein
MRRILIGVAFMVAACVHAPLRDSAADSDLVPRNDEIRINVTADVLGGLPRSMVNVEAHGDFPAATYEGVLLGELLRKYGAPAGESIRGSALRLVVVATAADGYQVAFALPELDPAFTTDVVLLADRKDGKPIAGAEGPFRLIVPNENRHSRWLRQLTTIELRRIDVR